MLPLIMGNFRRLPIFKKDDEVCLELPEYVCVCLFV